MNFLQKLFSPKVKKENPADVTISFKKGDMVKYRDACGFFLYGPDDTDDHMRIFYKPKGRSAIRVLGDMSFVDYITTVEGSNIPPKDMGQIKVTSLIII